MKKFLKLFALLVLTIVVVFSAYVYIAFVPVMTGMAAKTMCSCKYVMGRDEASVLQKELSMFPGLASATFIYGQKDTSVTARLLGRESKVIYRKGLGCTVLAERSEEEVRNQKINLPAAPSVNQDTLLWPAGDKLPDSAVAGIDYKQVQSAVDSAFVDIDPKNPVYTHAVIIVYDGKIIGEKYAAGFTKDSKMIGWSSTKSMTSALVGILVNEGRLNIEAPAPVREWQQDERSKITLNNLLQASSGLEWSESYFRPGDFHDMFMFSDDKGGFAASKKPMYKPNEHFEYSSGTANLISKIVRQTVGDEGYYRFVYEKFFYRIGMYHTLLEPDASGTFVGSSYGYASPRDWARFGLLYLNDGVWLGERILPEGWVKYSGTPATAAPMGEYGAHWWLNAGERGKPEHSKYPGLPHDTMVADGFEFQHVAVIPSKKLVIVRLGVTHNNNFSLAKLYQGVARGLPVPN